MARHLGISSQHNSPKVEKPDKFDEQFHRWPHNQSNVGEQFQKFADSKPPITADAIRATDASVVGWPKSNAHGQRCVAFPAFNRPGELTGYILRRVDGKDFTAVGRLQARKTHMLRGSQDGWVIPGEFDRVRQATTVWRVEGIPDALALFAFLPTDHAVITNICGAKSRPKNVDILENKIVNVVGDADVPGQQGATKFATGIFAIAKTTKIVALPYEATPNHGKDLRDFFFEGHSFGELLALAEAAPELTKTTRRQLTKQSKSALSTDSSTVPEVESDNDGGDEKMEASKIDSMQDARSMLAEIATFKEGIEEQQRLHSYRGSWWWWTGTHYREEADSDVEAQTIQYLDSNYSRLTRTAVGNVLLCLKSETNISAHQEIPSWLDGQRGGNWLPMKNGILDISSLFKGEYKVLVPHTPRFFSANCLPYDFDADAICPKWLAFLNRNLEGDHERIKLLQEFYGYCLTPTLSAHKFLFHEGEGANGKSVACAVLTAMLGTANFSSVPLETFGDRFSLYPTIGKLANVASEVGEIDRVAEGILKAYTTGDPIQFDRKHRDPITVRPTAKLVFASNNRPRFSDKSGGLWRRMILMPWRVTIPENDRVRGMDTPQWWHDQNELPGILLWAIAGLWHLEQQRGFCKSAVCEAALAEYRAESNPARLFLDERFKFDSESLVICEDVYRPYVEWTKSNGFLRLSASSFGHEVRRAFPTAERRQKLIGEERLTAYFGLAKK